MNDMQQYTESDFATAVGLLLEIDEVKRSIAGQPIYDYRAHRQYMSELGELSRQLVALPIAAIRAARAALNS